ncbi:MAG: sterol desaturase family protein [Candidatus Brocadia sp.]|nr:MAG: sterol desaturase family protein [Candidatus Brocadia sp.]
MNMSAFVLSHEVLIRLGAFFGVLAIMTLWELIAPRRTLTAPKMLRWMNNLGITFLNSFLLRIIFPAAAAGMATFAQKHGWGIFNYFRLPHSMVVVVSVIIMDFAIYLQHVMFHAVPVFWRMHRMHHADPDIDVTTGVRFHPFEIILSMLIKFAVIAALGTPVLAVVVFEVTLNATSLFNHGNVRILRSVDSVLRWFMVTPDMHRVHHSMEGYETNSNFGFNLPWWDRWLGTYRAQPRMGHEGMAIGLRDFQDTKRCITLPGMLAIPFIGKVTAYAITSRTWEESKDGH